MKLDVRGPTMQRRFTFPMAEEDFIRLKEVASKMSITPGAFIRSAMKDYIGKAEKQLNQG